MNLRTLTLGILALTCANAQTKLLRFPDLHNDQVVFTYAGDLWKAPSTGGTASRLTAHPGLEIFAKFSPDGNWIAFTGQYDGDEQVYVVPASGGIPKQLTFYPSRGPLPARWGYDHVVMGWTPDSKSIVFRSFRDYFSVGDGRLYTVALEGGLPKALPMPISGFGDLSPDGNKAVYAPLSRDFRTWKRYQGGWAQDLYIFDFKTSQIEPVSQTPRTERDPIWIGNKVYFSSDRSGTMNLYEFDIASKKTRALTDYKEWDVRWATRGNGSQIVYELNGEINTIDTKPGSKPLALRINVPNDGVASRPARKPVGNQIYGFALSPKGERALIDARGDIFTVPIENGNPRNLTKSSNAHDKAPRWSPDGSKIAYVSDASGEEEIYVANQDGAGKPEQLTSGSRAFIFGLAWSPDGKKIAYADKEGKLFVLTIDGKSKKEVVDSPISFIIDFDWATDSAHLAYSRTLSNGNSAIFLWSEKDGQTRQITNGQWSSQSPAFDPEGNYLYFVSEREFHPQISGKEWNFATSRDNGLYAMALRKDVKHPFPPKSDEVTIDKKDDKKEEKKDEKKPELRIDYEGLESRVARVPLNPDNYLNLRAVKGHLVYTRSGDFFYGRQAGGNTDLLIYSLSDRKESVLAENIAGSFVSSSGNKVLVRQGPAMNIYDVSPKGKDTRKPVSTAQLAIERVPQQEWAQIFNETWRRFRDFFYVQNMHGYDWESLRRQYAPQLEYVGHRTDLNYIIGEMISELNIGHAYIDGGDFEIPERPRVALPGARFELDEASGRYRISKIFKGHNEEPTYRSPLTEIGVNANVGDFILEIDGDDLQAPINPYKLLRGKADQPVKLLLNNRPAKDGAREVTFNPVASEAKLIYLEWIDANRQRVEKLTNGRAGYLHIPDMGGDGISEFIKWYYGQLNKEALVIDVRGNGGGNVSQMIIERLRRQLLALRYGRVSEEPATYPQNVFTGALVCLLNETSASDGDIFPYMFRQAGLGPLIGKRSWGGVVGITSYGPLLDGGIVNVPEFAQNDPVSGKYVIEGEGVTPDIVIENDPKSVIEGRDPQLERGVAEIMKKIGTTPKRFPPRPPDPVKTRDNTK